MAKKVILYPLVCKTVYMEDDKTRAREVEGSLLKYMHSAYVPEQPEIWEEDNLKWVENYVFEDTLTYTGFGRGQSAAYAEFEGTKGEKYTMFLKDLDDLIKTKDIVDQKVTAHWTFCKRGQNYGVRLATAKELPK